jgi:hypothetical protein
MIDNIPTFQLQNRHGRRERKHALSAVGFSKSSKIQAPRSRPRRKLAALKRWDIAVRSMNDNIPTVQLQNRHSWRERKRAMAEDSVAATRGNMRVFVSHFWFDGRRKDEIRRKCTTQIFEFAANYFTNKAGLACSITTAPRVYGRIDGLPNVVG